MNRTRFAVAIAVVGVGCVSVPDSIKGTFAPRQGSDVDNFSASAPHSFAPPELTQATVPIADASVASARTNAGDAGAITMCPRDESTNSASSASTSATTSNCLQDAGNP